MSCFVRLGRDLYSHFHMDADTGFEQHSGPNMTSDQVVAMNRIRRTIETLENKLDRIQVPLRSRTQTDQPALDTAHPQNIELVNVT